MRDEEPEITDELIDRMIARRAYEISQSEESQSAEDNWHRAEGEVRAEPSGPWAKTSSGDADSVTE